MSSNDTILTMENITKTFGPVKALTDVNLSVDRGEIHAICGENGAGKSTLMNVLSGVYPYGSYSGKITFDGKECKYHTINDSEADGIVIIHQELALSPFLSIAENIFIGNEQAKGGVIDWDKTRAEAKKLLDRVGLPEDPDTKVMDIGVGKQQLVEIAKALSKDVKLLILDEPTAALNDEDSAHLLDLVRQLRDEQGVTSIIITHKLNEVAAIADNVTIIRDGSTVGVMYVTPETPLDQEELIRKMVGRPLHNLYPNHPSNTPGEEYLRVEDWTVHHPLDAERVIVDHANINVHAGEIVGLAGLMGAGRTEMAMSIFGHSYGSNISGKVFVKGKEVKMPNVQSAIDAGLAYATEDRKGNGLNLLQNIRENASLASLTKISKGGVVDDNLERKEVEQYRKDFNIKCHDIDVNVSTLSGGNQQKVLLAKWVISQPDILILDEPTRGIDVGAKYEIYEIIDKLADAGKAVIVISSELPELIGICDRIYTVSYGVVTDNVEKNGFTQEYLMKGMTKEGRWQPDERRNCNTCKERRKDRPAGHGCQQCPSIRYCRRTAGHRRGLRGPDRRRAAEAELLRVPDSAERLRDHPGHWYGDGHHRHPHRPFGWFLGSLHRWCVCTADGTRRSQLDARHRHRSGRRPDRRRLAGLLGRRHRHPGLHYHSGRHVDLPWSRHRDRRRIRADYLPRIPWHCP